MKIFLFDSIFFVESSPLAAWWWLLDIFGHFLVILPNSQADGRRRTESFPILDFVTKDRMQNPDLAHLSIHQAIWGRVTKFFPLS